MVFPLMLRWPHLHYRTLHTAKVFNLCDFLIEESSYDAILFNVF